MEHRPRLSEIEYDLLQKFRKGSLRPKCEQSERKLHDSKVYTTLICSDPHGWLVDLKAWRCMLSVLRDNHFDEVIVNGDIADFPYISRHTKKLFDNGILKGYSEVEEVRYTRDQILHPLRASTDAKIRVRIGNHDERITSPHNHTQSQLARLAVLFQHYNTTSYKELLGITGEDFIYDDSDIHRMFDIFDICHGLKLSKNASRQNIADYLSSGSTGHTHRLNSTYITTNKGPLVWFESGHMRIGKNVEYLPTAVVADWQQGFVVINFVKDKDGIKFFGKSNIILDGVCEYNGKIYRGNI